ncbi:MAG: hypothetical protein EBZ13_06610 [Planctomycetia bacterium]|nr:hypothetical protein [Planctomycetia bacterium]
MKHRASPRFWRYYRALPQEIQQLADRGYQMLLQDPRHPSLHFKRIGRVWSARVGLHHRALATERDEEVVWIWIGTHADYDLLIRRKC